MKAGNQFKSVALFGHSTQAIYMCVRENQNLTSGVMLALSEFLTLLELRTTVPFVTAHLEIFHCTHHPVVPKSDLYFTFCSTLNALSKRTSK